MCDQSKVGNLVLGTLPWHADFFGKDTLDDGNQTHL